MRLIRFFFIMTFVLFSLKSSQAIELEEVLSDIKSLPVEKITIKKHYEDDIKKIRAIQIFVLPKTDKELEKLLKVWKENGVNTIIVRVFHNPGDRYHFYANSDLKSGVYFKTNRAPMISDALGTVLPLAHSMGIRVYAWMTTRYADYNSNELEKMIAYSVNKKSFQQARGLNIFSSEVQEYILSLFSDLAKYPIDGILLQDDLFVRYNEGFDFKTMADFQQEMGFYPNPNILFKLNGNGAVIYNDNFWIWRKWKSQKIAKFVGKINEKIKQINPSIKLVVNLTYEAIAHPKGALAWLAHDIESLKDVSDYFSLMAYHRQIMDEINISLQDSYIYLENMITKCMELFSASPERVLFKIQIKDWKSNEPININEILNLINYAKDIKNLSIAIVPYPPEAPLQILKTIFLGS